MSAPARPQDRRVIRTLSGDLAPAALGRCLTHEHFAVDMRLPVEGPHHPLLPGYADETALEQAILPAAQALADTGIDAIVECTPADMGRRLALYRAVGERTGLAVIACAGTYRQAWIPRWMGDAPVEAVAARFLEDIQERRCGAIKLGCDPDGPSALEAMCAAAAGRVSRATGVLAVCHVERGPAAARVLDAFEAGGGDPARFAIVHCHEEPSFALHLALARRGAWLSYDRIGGRLTDAAYARLVLDAAAAGYAAQVLISQDAPAYIVGQDGAGRLAPVDRFTHLPRCFLPAVRDAGADAALVERLLVENPRRALAFTPPR